ncbi:MAG: M6 family metalloprotease domain-containing protein [Paludibacteraceae bacterium]|nr:M6 family metalloprotease domain-containing protein [Paludibacteraceae bacterium]
MTARTNILLLLLLVCLTVWSVPARTGWINYTQPDGSSVRVRIEGDEWNRWYADTSDNLLVADSTGHLINIQDRAVREKRKIRQVNRTPAAYSIGYPTTGSPRALVLLVSFKDRGFSSPTAKADFDRLLNQQGYHENGATGSAVDYFRACSGGLFTPQFDVYGPYELAHEMAYYGANSGGSDQRPAYMVAEACSLANKDIDFSRYDLNNDGLVDNVFIFYAGYNEAEGASANTIWPHRWVVYPTGQYGSNGNYEGTVNAVTFDGKRIADYACTSELTGNTGTTRAPIGTFCHEFGHVLGLPDFYHTTDSKQKTMGEWDIMDYGCYNNDGRTPPLYGAYSRFFMGWEQPKQLTVPETATLDAISTSDESTGTTAYLVARMAHNLSGTSPSPSEFFLLEYRTQAGWDEYLPEEGLLIWHIDYNQSLWQQNIPNNYDGSRQTPNNHMHIYLKAPDGSSSTAGGAYTTGDEASLDLWSGAHITMVDNLYAEKQSIMFDVFGGCPYDITPPHADTTTDIGVSSARLCFTDMRSAAARDSVETVYIISLSDDDNHLLTDTIASDKTDLTLLTLQDNTTYKWDIHLRITDTDGKTYRSRPSNQLSFSTRKQKRKELPMIIHEQDGENRICIIRPDTDTPLCISDCNGHVVSTYSGDEAVVHYRIQQFTPHQLYIIHQGKQSAKFVVQ